MRDNSSHIVIIFLLTAITINLFILDLKVFSPANNIALSDITSIATPNPTITNNPQLTTNNLSCPNSCLGLIQQATNGGKLEDKGSDLKGAKGLTPTTREFYIPLGNGTTTKSDWDDLIATETVIDPLNYGRIKEAYFIASLRNPTQNGQVEAQLYNVTDKHLVWGSQVVMNGPSQQTVTSDKITLYTGAKLYRVQLKSTLQFLSFLDNAKIRIITQ